MIDQVIYKGEEIAVLAHDTHQTADVTFLTNNDDTLQVGLLRRPAGRAAAPRRRIYAPQVIGAMQQMIYVIEGTVTITLYDEVTEEGITTIEMHAGDAIFLRKQAHGVHFTKDSLILETKQGPYVGNQPSALLKRYQTSKE